MHKAMARAQMLKSFTLKYQQSNKCLWGNKRGRTRKNSTNELQDLDLLGSPHLEGRWIGGNVDLDLLSLLPQRYARIMGEIERGGFSKVNNGGRDSAKPLGKVGEQWGRRPLK